MKLTDNEIIKALENCGGAGECQKCPLNDLGEDISLCIPHLTQNALDLINRKKSEIERLIPKCEDCAGCSEWKCDCSNIRTEAIKEVTAELYNSFVQLEKYDTLHIYEFLDRIDSVEEFLLTK